MVKDYRLYCFDGASRITGAEWLQAADDAQAMNDAKHVMTGIRCEVWDRDRLVGRYQPRSTSMALNSAEVSRQPLV
jgi:hypothetical protein